MRRICYYIISFASFISSAIARDGVLKLEADTTVIDGKVLHINIYIRNVDSKNAEVAVGPILDIVDLGKFVSCKARLERTLSGELVKPSPRLLDIIILMPNQLTKIGSIDKLVSEIDKDNMLIYYEVPQEFSKIYDVWTGRCETTISLRPR
jgi:hypothetical protein